LQPIGPTVQQFTDQSIGAGVLGAIGKGCRIGQLEVVGVGRAELEIETGVVGESQRPWRKADLPLEYAGGGRCPPDGLDDVDIHFAGRGQAGPRIALLMRDAGQAGEPSSGCGDVDGALPIMNRQAKGATTGGEPANDVAIDPGKGMRPPECHSPRRLLI